MTSLARSNLLSCRLAVLGNHECTVFGLGIGCFGELCAGFGDVCTIIARNLAVSYVDRYDDRLHGSLYSVKAMPLSFCSQDFPRCLFVRHLFPRRVHLPYITYLSPVHMLEWQPNLGRLHDGPVQSSPGLLPK